MEIINIFDKNFIPYGDDSSTHKKTPRNITYIKGERNWGGITIYTDLCFGEVFNTKSKFNVAWQLESPSHSNKQFYPMLKYADKFDLILTYDQGLVEKMPHKFKPINVGGTTVKEPQLYKKNKNICIVHSGKRDTPNHDLRFKVINTLPKNMLDVYGKVTGTPFDNVADVYKDHRYAIIIENVNTQNYFSEKLTDALACGCIPIYNGCNHPVVDIFDMKSIPTWSNMKDLLNMVCECNEDRYNKLLESIESNLNIVKKDFYTNEDWLWDNYLKHLK